MPDEQLPLLQTLETLFSTGINLKKKNLSSDDGIQAKFKCEKSIRHKAKTWNPGDIAHSPWLEASNQRRGCDHKTGSKTRKPNRVGQSCWRRSQSCKPGMTQPRESEPPVDRTAGTLKQLIFRACLSSVVTVAWQDDAWVKAAQRSKCGLCLLRGPVARSRPGNSNLLFSEVHQNQDFSRLPALSLEAIWIIGCWN